MYSITLAIIDVVIVQLTHKDKPIAISNVQVFAFYPRFYHINTAIHFLAANIGLIFHQNKGAGLIFHQNKGAFFYVPSAVSLPSDLPSDTNTLKISLL